MLLIRMNYQIQKLISQINDLSDFSEVARSEGFLDLVDFLSLKKSLLLLKLVVLSKLPPQSKETLENRSEPKPFINPNKRGDIKDQILGFIKERKEVSSLEIFNAFRYLSRRSIKRYIESLLKDGAIKRIVINNNKTLYNAQ